MNFLTMDFFLSLMITFFVLGILSQILIGVLYQHMIEEAENMQNTTNKLLKQLKQKFINNYNLNDGVTNVPVFVDKFINRLQIGKISLNALKNFSGQSMLLSVLAAGIGICRGLMNGAVFFAMLPYYIITFLGLYVYFSVLSIVDIPARKNMLKTNLVDYLENHMILRLEAASAFADLPEEEIIKAAHPRPEEELVKAVHPRPEVRTAEMETFIPKEEEIQAEMLQKKPLGLDWTGTSEPKPYLNKDQEAELAELLREFLT